MGFGILDHVRERDKPGPDIDTEPVGEGAEGKDFTEVTDVTH